ncbi:hypothetical protein [Winogradskyella sp.]|uniref:hypothetical protein n=1 Tax=Winogradskyella sp. TaxID=1883156 RepID=UPI002618C102|nr:hypothetical protein [Winogradskyella sp.]
MVFYGPFGIEEGDMGSIFGISWSMYNGYFPHRDFVYIKPAFSPFFHSLPLYLTEDYAYLINRYLYYVQVFGYSYLASLIAVNFLKIPKKYIYFIAIIGALVSVHNYPPMPWNTIDGIFFSVLGLFFIVKRPTKSWLIVLGAFFLFLGALCKQSFYFFPPLVALFLLYRREFKPFLILSISGLLFITLFLWFYWWQDALNSFIEQMFSFTPGSSLINTGIRSYYLAIKFNILYIVLAGIALWLIKKFTKSQIALLLTNVLIVLVFIWLYYKNQSLYQYAKYGIIHILWLFGIFFSIINSIKDKEYTILILLFSLSWCASISNGYNTPIDFSTPMFLVVMLVCLGKNFQLRKWIAIVIVSLYFGTFYYGYQNPYREEKRNVLNHHLGDIFPRLQTIYTNQTTYYKFEELKELSSKYDNFTILPSMTLGHYITNTVNPIGVDWVFNHHLADKLETYKQTISDKKLTIFIENFENHYDNYEETSLLTMYVVKHWKLIERNEHFRVYQQP